MILILKSLKTTLPYLRGHIVGRVARSHQHPIVRPELLCEPEIADPNRFRIARVVRVEDIRRLEISAQKLNYFNLKFSFHGFIQTIFSLARYKKMNF